MNDTRKPTVMGAVLGSYRITGALGAGGMGSVFTAVHVQTGKPAAVKLLRKELTDNDELVERFFNEARAATRIRHPGIIEVYDFGHADDGRAFLAMELLEGVTLRQRIAQKQRLSEDEARAIARGVAEALAAAHAAAIVHRDLKPDNIFLVGGTTPKVLDFGIAKLLDRVQDEVSRTRTGSLIGTPVYMAPEQARAAGSIDARADLYSLGCILYEMVAGAPPFVGNIGELLAAHMFTEPPHLDEPMLDALVQRLLAKEPADRPRDAAAVAEALAPRQARTFGDERALAPVGTERGWIEAPPEVPPARRSAMPLIAGVATIAIAAAALGFVLTRGGDDDRKAIAAPAPVVEARPITIEPIVPPPSKPVVTPIAPPPPPVVVKKVQTHHVQHTAQTSTGPVTMPDASPHPAVVTQPEPLATPKGAPLSGEP